MYAFNCFERYVLRTNDESIVKLAQLVADQYDDVGVIFGDHVTVCTGEQWKWWSFDLLTGTTRRARLAAYHRCPRGGRIGYGMALVTSRTRRMSEWSTREEVTIHIDDWFSPWDPARADLDVVRDAWFARDFVRAKELAVRVIPRSCEMFLACVKREYGLLCRSRKAS